MQQLDTSSVWQVTNQEQIAVNQGEKGKTDYKIPKKTNVTVIDGINSLRSEAEAKGKVDIYCQLPICTCHMKWLFCQSFFSGKNILNN